jgi:putative MATE family efflux protein
MKRVDFDKGSIVKNILQASFPMLVAQMLNLLYNIVDRIFIARIPGEGTAAIGGVGLCFSVILMITAFTNLFGQGGSPLFAIERGRKRDGDARKIMGLVWFLITAASVILTAALLIFAEPLLHLVGASDAEMKYSLPYMRIYALGTFCSMTSVGLNPFINAQGYFRAGMISVVIGAAANIALDPVFIFTLHMGVSGAALATILSQMLSALYTLHFLMRSAELTLAMPDLQTIRRSGKQIGSICSLGTAPFIMYFTNSMVAVVNNTLLAKLGGDLYVSSMTVISSVRQIVDTPVMAVGEGSSPIISYNYGAGKPDRVVRAAGVMLLLQIGYCSAMWIFILKAPHVLAGIFTSDYRLLDVTARAMRIYFNAFAFMALQYTGQTVFKSLNKKKRAIFFSLLRKAVIVIPLAYLLPYRFGMGTDGVFMAEPVSNVIGGSACFLTMLCTILPEMKRMKEGAA